METEWERWVCWSMKFKYLWWTPCGISVTSRLDVDLSALKEKHFVCPLCAWGAAFIITYSADWFAFYLLLFSSCCFWALWSWTQKCISNIWKYQTPGCVLTSLRTSLVVSIISMGAGPVSYKKLSLFFTPLLQELGSLPVLHPCVSDGPPSWSVSLTFYHSTVWHDERWLHQWPTDSKWWDYELTNSTSTQLKLKTGNRTASQREGRTGPWQSE